MCFLIGHFGCNLPFAQHLSDHALIDSWHVVRKSIHVY